MYVVPLRYPACSLSPPTPIDILLYRCPTLHVDTPSSWSLSSCTPPAIIHPSAEPSQHFLSSRTALYNLKQEVNCTAFGLSVQVLGSISIGAATLNILYGAWTISRKYGRLLTIFLAIAEVGHWAILTWNIFTVHSEWVLAVKKCNITLTGRPALLTLYVYSMCPFPGPASLQLYPPLTAAMLFDGTILLVCLTGIYKHTSEAGAVQGQFWQLLRRQGLLVISVGKPVSLTNNPGQEYITSLSHSLPMSFLSFSCSSI